MNYIYLDVTSKSTIKLSSERSTIEIIVVAHKKQKGVQKKSNNLNSLLIEICRNYLFIPFLYIYNDEQ